jgi:alginate O-acetyltransferase complex protein AlgI
MLFNSFQFAVFLPIVFFLYWFATNGSLKRQNLLLLFASYYFYSCWDWRFLSLLLSSTVLDYFTGIKINGCRSSNARKAWLYTSVILNLGFLGIFKYYNFFAASFADMVQVLGFEPHITTLSIILPVGISFYTFHGLSYVFDIYNRKMDPTKNFIDYSLFVSFFPLLVAGPIERATHLLPQIEKPRTFRYGKAVDGLRQILWGVFKKAVIADNCAQCANLIFNNYTHYSGSTLVMGAVFFAFQIYGDFSGYSDIALGTARLFGIELLRNFTFPYFSRDIAEFWRRWHISLSSWFRDYVYIPLGGSRGSTCMKVRNTFIIFLLSGFWHGANWTFIAWGALNALYFLPLLLLNRNRTNLGNVAHGRIWPTYRELLQMAATFGLTVFAWVFFRADSIAHAFGYISQIFSRSIASLPLRDIGEVRLAITAVALLIPFLIIEWVGRENNYAIECIILHRPRWMRWGFYSFLVFLIGMFIQTEESPFIYFQF